MLLIAVDLTDLFVGVYSGGVDFLLVGQFYLAE
jgi:hypothetical protein